MWQGSERRIARRETGDRVKAEKRVKSYLLRGPPRSQVSVLPLHLLDKELHSAGHSGGGVGA